MGCRLTFQPSNDPKWKVGATSDVLSAVDDMSPATPSDPLERVQGHPLCRNLS